MRTVKAGLFSGALWGALFLLCGCTVPDVPPVPLSTSLESLSNAQYVELCNWSIDYMGGRDYKHPESDDDNNTAVHICPPTEEDLGLPEENPRRYTRWGEEQCEAHIAGLTERSGIVDDYVRLVYEVSDRPCVNFALQMSNGIIYTVVYEEEEG